MSLKDGIHVKDSEKGEEVHIAWDAFKTKSSKQEGDDFEDDDCFKVEPIIINGEYFASMDDVEKKYEDLEKKCENRNPWVKFPFALIAVVVYLLLGFLTGAWLMGLFVLLTIPIYYVVVKGIIKRRPAKVLEGLYPILCVSAFLFVGLFYDMWHPGWIIFLTIPIFEWACNSISKSYRRRSKPASSESGALD